MQEKAQSVQFVLFMAGAQHGSVASAGKLDHAGQTHGGNQQRRSMVGNE